MFFIKIRFINLLFLAFLPAWIWSIEFAFIFPDMCMSDNNGNNATGHDKKKGTRKGCIRGHVIAIDESQNSVFVKGGMDNQARRFYIDSKTKVVGKLDKLGDSKVVTRKLIPGSQVSVKYAGDETLLLADLIEVIH